MYVVIVVLSVFSCWVVFALEVTNGNVSHVQNGRAPNAGAAIFPTIPLVQITYVLVAWGIEQFHRDIGPAVVAIYSLLSTSMRLLQYQKARRIFKALDAITRGPAA
jgi:hypothetical protein